MIITKPIDTTLDFTPGSGAAPRRSLILNHALTEAKLIVRNGEQLMVALLIPLALLFFGHFAKGRYGITEETIAPTSPWDDPEYSMHGSAT